MHAYGAPAPESSLDKNCLWNTPYPHPPPPLPNSPCRHPYPPLPLYPASFTQGHLWRISDEIVSLDDFVPEQTQGVPAMMSAAVLCVRRLFAFDLECAMQNGSGQGRKLPPPPPPPSFPPSPNDLDYYPTDCQTSLLAGPAGN